MHHMLSNLWRLFLLLATLNTAAGSNLLWKTVKKPGPDLTEAMTLLKDYLKNPDKRPVIQRIAPLLETCRAERYWRRQEYRWALRLPEDDPLEDPHREPSLDHALDVLEKYEFEEIEYKRHSSEI